MIAQNIKIRENRSIDLSAEGKELYMIIRGTFGTAQVSVKVGQDSNNFVLAENGGPFTSDKALVVNWFGQIRIQVENVDGTTDLSLTLLWK